MASHPFVTSACHWHCRLCAWFAHSCAADVAARYLFKIVDTVRKFGHTSGRVRMFGILSGILKPDMYASRISYVVMALFTNLFPKFSAAVLKNRK